MFGHDDSLRSTALISYWFASLYVLCEGWKELGLKDEAIDDLLEDATAVAAVRRFRNAVFHFQTSFKDPRFSDFETIAPAISWSMFLTKAFG